MIQMGVDLAVVAGLTAAIAIGIVAAFLFRRKRREQRQASGQPTPVVPLDNVQFTVYRPSAISPDRWYSLLAFAHLAARRGEDPPNFSPLAEVQRQAERILAVRTADYGTARVDGTQGIPRGGDLTIVPRLDGIEFNPSQCSFRWHQTVHRAEFQFRSIAGQVPRVARGHVAIFMSGLIVGEVPLAIPVEAQVEESAPRVADQGRSYRKMFASYSHLDGKVVEQFEAFMHSLGDRYVRDVRDLRAGQVWSTALENLIRQADVFQLFWSWNALASPYVRREWEFALALGRTDFVRPVYWEEPLPARGDLPPATLRSLHFYRLSAQPHSDADTARSATVDTSARQTEYELATLAVYRGDEFLRNIELTDAPMRIGRAPENEIVLEDPEKRVSRTHAEIRYERGQHVVTDLKSHNGVWVGERRVKSEPLPVDTALTIGPYRLILRPSVAAIAAPDAEAVSPGGTVISRGVPDVEPQAPEPPPPTQSTLTVKVGSTNGPASRRVQNRTRLMATAATFVAVVTAGFVIVAIVRKDPPPLVSETTTMIPAEGPKEPIDEERFQEQFNRAQAVIESGDKASAIRANTEALNVLAADTRALEQQVRILEMPDRPGATPLGEKVIIPPPPLQIVLPTLKVPQRTGETLAQRAAREKIAKDHLDQGKRALDEQRFADAIGALEAAIETSDRQDYGYSENEARNLLQNARMAQATISAGFRRATAQKALEQAKAAMAASDLPGAINRAQEARSIDAQIPGLADLLKEVEQHARTQGEAAFKNAKALAGYGRPEAVKEYEKAVQLLGLVPGGHPELAEARRRLNELKTPR
jgi:pSer/pThr/pTyr-binding forkhead associated (FHA) protein/tetratricopeptide (TPR) repeat protein